ncbi:hypothetical protein ACH4UM_18875 [Streptomyces sp. NPDC020801]
MDAFERRMYEASEDVHARIERGEVTDAHAELLQAHADASDGED